RALHRAGVAAAAARETGARLRPARAPAGADRRAAGGDGQPLPPPARPRGGGRRLLGVGRSLTRPREAPLRADPARPSPARPLGRRPPALAGANPTLSRPVRGEEVTMHH